MGDCLHDGASALGGVAALEDAAAHEHAVHAQLQRREGRPGGVCARVGQLCGAKVGRAGSSGATPGTWPRVRSAQHLPSVAQQRWEWGAGPGLAAAPPTCIISAASAGVATPPAAKLTTGRRPSALVCRTNSTGARISCGQAGQKGRRRWCVCVLTRGWGGKGGGCQVKASVCVVRETEDSSLRG